jgi:hypothetical protein
MPNRETTPTQSALLKNKLASLVLKLQKSSSPRGTLDFPTLEQTVAEAVRLLKLFYQDLSDPGFRPTNVIVDTEPDPDVLNENMDMVMDDLTVLFAEFENLEAVVLGNFNYMVSRLNRLNRKLKSVSSKTADFVLFSNLATKDALFFADSFNSLERVELQSPLLNADQAEVNQVEGVVSLPVDRVAQKAIFVTEIPVINTNSNGTSGNNFELNTQLNGDITTILDNNADTWFEYERVLDVDDGEPLVFDFTVNLGESKVVNFVRINPNNFGTKTQVQIDAIDTSVDGQEFLSVKDDIPIADFLVEDEENVFALAPSTSKYAGQGLFTFTPRKAKYIKISLRQTTPYIIQAATGEKIRYAIGIRDVHIEALPYKSEGELISKRYGSTDEIRKVVLLSSQNPDASFESQLASVRHYISPDNGITWYEIRPKVSLGLSNTTQAVPELLDFNGAYPWSIKTQNPVTSLRYKAVFKRDTEAFSETSTELAQSIQASTELFPVPGTSPYTLTLKNSPVPETLKLIDPSMGSRGNVRQPYNITRGTGSKLRVLLPFPLKRDTEKDEGFLYTGAVRNVNKVDPQTIYVEGVPWSRELSSTSGGSDTHYDLNLDGAELEFGDGSIGGAVADGATVSMTLQEERLYPSHDEEHITLLDYPTPNDQGQFKLERVELPVHKIRVLDKNAGTHFLEKNVVDILGYPIIFSDTAVFSAIKTFVDGSSELTSPGDYSLDYENGVLYSRDRTSASADTTISYFYRPRTELTPDQWKFVGQDGIANAVSIDSSAWKTFPGVEQGIPYGSRYIGINKVAVVKGSIAFDGTVSGVFDREVPFIDGRTELVSAVETSEVLPTITTVSGSNLEIPFTAQVTSATDFAVTFTNQDVFAVEKSSRAAVDTGTGGDFYVDRGTSSVYFQSTGPTEDPGNVRYFYENPNANLTGVYSVNYGPGEMYTYNQTDSPNDITMTYQYTDYRATYNVAREISSTDWDLDTSNNTVTIADREILRNNKIPQVEDGTKYYQASYEHIAKPRDDIDELEPFFSPVLKSYALKVITASKLV